ncbi:DUF4265 domain-containing protein [Flavobacterium agricola]|uniref:DUF4265 domain-containing protein n=1 Tax=Flavobacterium agricola TaxID=2870839 RepID=A0ABY6LZE2_9FLAO|nr:DUF4265 domain-containing protein [Flavobacterium agricola]UYW01646.1 DUF4265 domain-containing protein [Flavobacterium agricola]
MEQENFREVIFQYQSNITNEEVNEALWAEVINAEDGVFMLYSIPLHGFLIAPGDIFVAVEEEIEGETHFVFDHVTNYSGNSVIQVIIPYEDNSTEVEQTLNTLTEKNCHIEKISDNIILLAVPFEVNYQEVKQVIEALAISEMIDYAEPIISDKHQEDIEEAQLNN